jgi:RHS repeat-associated protein
MGCLRLEYYNTFEPSKNYGIKILTSKKSIKNARRYNELKDHLANVKTVISDEKLITDAGTPNVIDNNDNFTPKVLNYQDFMPFGMPMPGRNYQSSSSYRFGFNGQEKDDEIAGAGNIMTAEFWEYDSRTGRRWNTDPASSEKPWMSSYHAFSNKPILNIDPNGATDSPVYDNDGNLLGTDDQGLSGKAIVMDKDKFQQGMKHEDAAKNNQGVAGLKDDKAKTNFIKSYSELPTRPDYDGKLTLDEANKWYREGGGKPLFVDASKIDLDPVSKSDFKEVGASIYKNFALTSNTETGAVYGTIKLTLVDDKGVIKLGGNNGLLDIYDFDYKKVDGPKTLVRNIATWIGEQNAGKGVGYTIFDYGTGKVK